jgi:hypothetical protein
VAKKKQVVLCDLNMEDRDVICTNIVLAMRVASDIGANVVGWCAVSSIAGRRRLTQERSDLLAISAAIGTPATYIQPTLTRRALNPAMFFLLLKMVFTSCFDSEKLARLQFSGVPVGMYAIDSQRRRTLRLDAHPFVWLRRDSAQNSYPWNRRPKSSWITAIALFLPRFAVRSWLNLQFWSYFLETNEVFCSVQAHVERAEFGVLTKLLTQREVPILVVSEKIERFEEDAEIVVTKGRNWLSNQKSSDREELFSVVRNDIEQSIQGQVRTKRRHTQTAPRDVNMDLMCEDLISELLNTYAFVIAVLLPATYEAFNHQRSNLSFFSYHTWFDSIFRVAKVCNAGLLLKVHPLGDSGEPVRVKKFLEGIGSQASTWEIAPQRASLLPLSKFTRRLVATSLSSSSLIELQHLGVRSVVADTSSYKWWSFARPPRSKEAYEAHLLKTLCSPFSPSDEYLEAALLTSFDNNWIGRFTCLTSSASGKDLNPNVPMSKTVYGQSSKGLRLSREGILEGFKASNAWRKLLYEYQPPVL